MSITLSGSGVISIDEVFLMCNYGEEWAASIFIEQIADGSTGTMNTGSGRCQDVANETCCSNWSSLSYRLIGTFAIVMAFVKNFLKVKITF